MRAPGPLEDRPLKHASRASSSTNSKLIHAPSEISQLPACSDVKDIEHNSGFFPWVAGVLAAVGDEVFLIRAEVHKANLEAASKYEVTATQSG